MNSKRLFSLLLAFTLAFALALPASAAGADGWLVPKAREYTGQFTDVTGSWCETAVKTVYEAGLMEGKTSNTFDPKGTLMPEQLVVICARLHSRLTDGSAAFPAPTEGEAWYDPYYTYLADALDYPGGADGLMFNVHATKYPVNRLCFAELLGQTLDSAGAALPEINEVSAIPDWRWIPEPEGSSDPVLPFYRAGILNGVDQWGTFDSDSVLNRGQAAAMLARAIDPRQRLQFELPEFGLCRDVLGVESDTVLFTVAGEGISAGLFADLLTSTLYHYGRNDTTQARTDAMRYWCEQQQAIHLLAQQKGISLTAKKLAQAETEAASKAGYLGLSQDYFYFQDQTIQLNISLFLSYYEADWKTGEYTYHRDLAALASQLTAETVPTEALLALDLPAVYDRLMASPYPGWVFPDYP